MPLDVVRAKVPLVEGCPATLRTAAFLVPQTATPSLEFVFRDDAGRPVDLSGSLPREQSQSAETNPDAAEVRVRVREWFAADQPHPQKSWALDGYSPRPEEGLLRVDLTPAVTALSGVYRVAFGVVDSGGRLLAVREAYLGVERSGFSGLARRQGPPTVADVRLSIRDQDPRENINLDAVEFSDAQVLLALARPVAAWNETTPVIRPRFSTQTFPQCDLWASAAAGYLFEAAAQGYRRDWGLVEQSGGISVRDKDKERLYAAEAQRRVGEYLAWVKLAKNQLNMKKLYQYHPGRYGRLGGGW